MKLKQFLDLAESSPKDATESDVTSFFCQKDQGHWPDEHVAVTLSLEDGDILFISDGNVATSSPYLISASAKLWILNKFFKQFPPEGSEIASILEDNEGEPESGQAFQEKVMSRMNKQSKFMRDGNRWVGFRKEVLHLSDHGTIFLFDSLLLSHQWDGKLSVVIPSSVPTVFTYRVRNKEVVMSTTTLPCHDFMKSTSWEQAGDLSYLPAPGSLERPASRETLNFILDYAETLKNS